LITEALRHDVPALVEVLVNRQELSMPPTITLEQMKGFSLFMIRAVLSGRGDEIIDLAKRIFSGSPCIVAARSFSRKISV